MDRVRAESYNYFAMTLIPVLTPLWTRGLTSFLSSSLRQSVKAEAVV